MPLYRDLLLYLLLGTVLVPYAPVHFLFGAKISNYIAKTIFILSLSESLVLYFAANGAAFVVLPFVIQKKPHKHHYVNIGPFVHIYFKTCYPHSKKSH